MSVVLVTGANRGIGLELVRQYSEAGYRVHACHRSESEALDSLASNAESVTAHRIDITDHEAVDWLADSLNDESIDILINNAGRYGKIGLAVGGAEDQAFGNSDYDDWAYTFNVNVFGPMKVSEAFVEHIARSDAKKIVHITSFLGSSTLNTRAASGEFAGGMYAYRTSKTSVNILTRSMAEDLAPRGITVMAVHPGWVKTDMGGPDAQVDAKTSVDGIRNVIESTSLEDSGILCTFDGEILPP